MPLLHPAFLFALAAVVVPVLIHLSQRRKFERFEVGTLRFLKLAEKKRNLRLRVEEPFLLLLRMLAVALLAFVFARPFLSGREKAEVPREMMLILLDASGSMTPAMAEKAADLAADAAKADGAVVFARFADEVEVLASLDDYRPISGAPGDFGKALAWSLDHLRGEGIEHARVVVIGHFAASSLPSVPPRVWPPRVEVEAIAIDPPEARNEAVTGVELLTPFVTGRMEIEASLTPSDKEREVVLSSEGLNVKRTVPAGARRVAFAFRPPREEVRGFVSLESEDAWPADDRRPFAVRWAEPEPVLILDGWPGSTPFEGQGYFLEKALSASGAAHGLSPFRPEVKYGLDGRVPDMADPFADPGLVPRASSRPGAVDVSKFSAIALCGPTGISSGEAESIASRVAAGAGLCICIDERWTPQATAFLAEHGLFPETVEFTGGMQHRRIARWDETHPALARFDGRDGGDLRLLTWQDAFTIHPGDGWHVLATLEGGGPLLLEKVSTDPEAGRVMVLAHPLTRGWTDLPREPMFVPFVKSLFTELTRYEPREHSAGVREPGIRESRAIGWHGSSDNRSEVVAAAASEAAVQAVDAAAFRRAFGLPDAGSATPPPLEPDDAEAGAERAKEGEWWPWLVAALLLLLTLECAVATRRAAPVEAKPVET